MFRGFQGQEQKVHGESAGWRVVGLALGLMFFGAVGAGEVRHVTLSDGDRERYEAVFAPRVVAELPGQEASYTLCKLPDGRLRFYGWQWIDGRRRRAYIESGNLGLDWKLELAGSNDVQSAMLYDPKSLLKNKLNTIRRIGEEAVL